MATEDYCKCGRKLISNIEMAENLCNSCRGIPLRAALIKQMGELEQQIGEAQEKTRRVHSLVMRYVQDEGGGSKPNLAMMELAVRSIGQAKDAVRYSRHATEDK